MSTSWHYIKAPFDGAEFIPHEFRVGIPLTDTDELTWVQFSEGRFLEFLSCIADKDSTALVCLYKQIESDTRQAHYLLGMVDESEWLISECYDIKRAGDVIAGRTRV